MRRTIGLLLGPILFLFIFLGPRAEGMTPQMAAVLAVTALTATWWITEAVPIAIASLVPMVLLPLTGALDIGATTAAYGHYIVFLFLGGFMLALAFERCGLHRRAALSTIELVGSNPRMIVLGAMIATAVLSMWISNTATSVMMLPIAIAISSQFADDPNTPADENAIFGKALMLSIAYAASIGGMGTLIGTPVNLALAGSISATFGVEIGFLEWMAVGLPVAVVLTAICWWYLTRVAYNLPTTPFAGGRAEIRRLRLAMGKMTAEEWKVLAVFVLVALCWIFRKSVLVQFLPGINDTVIAIAGAIALFLVPGKTKGEGLLRWDEAVRLPWGVVLLMGGGFALAAAFKAVDLATYLGSVISVPDGTPLLLVILLVVAAVNFLTEVTSNVATINMLLPVLVAAAVPLGVHPYALMIPATLAAGCAFMLPVATPPNAVVFGSGHLTIPDMVRAGLRMNLISIVVIALFSYFLLPWLMGISL